MHFTKRLTDWYSKKKRSLPWRQNQEPYQVWLSEIILQQTRVDQGLPYFLRFTTRFPDVASLAAASEAEVLKLWQGLGYYSRARNMHKAAKQVIIEFDGKFPGGYQELLQLKGVGPYSAAAIASICYKEPVAVVDGNVYRFLSRHFGIETPIDIAKGKQIFLRLAEALLDKHQPGNFNQAMMEFGATVCKPRNPSCSECPFRMTCKAFELDEIQRFPIKAKKQKTQNLYLHYFVIRVDEGVYLQQRSEKGIWANMYEFPVLSSDKKVGKKDVESAATKLGLPPLAQAEKSAPVKHMLTHRKITAHFWSFEPKEFHPEEGMIFISDGSALQSYALPKLIERYLYERIFVQRDKIVI